MPVPVQYFQAIATAIPTLVVALLVTARLSERTMKAGNEIVGRDLRLVLGVYGVVMVGEVSALVGIIRGGGSTPLVLLSTIPVFIVVALLVFIMLPQERTISDMNLKLLAGALMFVAMAGALTLAIASAT